MYNGIIKRSQVEYKSNYQDYRNQLRQDFLYMCAYCFVPERFSQNLSYQIDHYKPISKSGAKSDYTNLFYSCNYCNRYKSDYWSEVQENQIIRIDEQNPIDHFDHSASKINGITCIGRITIEKCKLNRAYLLKYRELRADAISQIIEYSKKKSFLEKRLQRMLRHKNTSNAKHYHEISHSLRVLDLSVQSLKDKLMISHKLEYE